MISHRLTNPYLLIFGSLVGVAIRTVTICIIMGRRGYRYRPNFHMTDTVRQIFVLALPVFLGSTAGQINLFINKTLASGLATGSVAALSYAELLTGLITGVTATIISTVLYPRLAQAFAQSDEERFRDIFTSGVNLLVIIGAPFTLGILVYSRPVVQIIYERGVFNSASTEMTAAAFFFYGIGLIFSMIQLFLVQAFYSRHNTRTPLVVGAFIVAINIIANLILVKYLAHGGLALGWSIATFCNTILLLVAFRKKNPAMLSKALVIKNIRTCLAAAVSVGASYFCYRLLSVIFSIEGWILPRTLQLGVSVLVAASAYVILLRLFKTEELIHFRRIFRLPSENTKE
jgi:putative peptidoglycan lipid II flippase